MVGGGSGARSAAARGGDTQIHVQVNGAVENSELHQITHSAVSSALGELRQGATWTDGGSAEAEGLSCRVIAIRRHFDDLGAFEMPPHVRHEGFDYSTRQNTECLAFVLRDNTEADCEQK